MASERDHIDLANKNQQTLVYLLEQHSSHPEWIATVAFYKSVHLIEAVFHAKWSVDSRNHTDRLDRVKRLLDSKIFNHFHVLYQKSRIARYLADSDSRTLYKTFTDHMSADLVVSELVNKRLYVLEQMVLKDLSKESNDVLQKVHVQPLVAANPP